MQASSRLKKKIVQNFEFDPSQMIKQEGFEIFNALNILLNEQFTLKRLDLKDIQHKSLHHLMLNQVAILKPLNGANILKCHKILKSQNHIYLVFDFCSGKSVTQIIEKQNQRNNQDLVDNTLQISYKNEEEEIGLNFIQSVAKQLYLALKQLQSHRIIHLNINPTNLIIGKKSELKLTNFFQSKQLQSQDEGTLKEKIESNSYTDPYLKKTGKFGFFTDIYSFGKVLSKLYELYKASDKFRRDFNIEQIILNTTLQNPHERFKLKKIYQNLYVAEPQSNNRRRQPLSTQSSLVKYQSLNKVQNISNNKQKSDNLRKSQNNPRKSTNLNYEALQPMNHKRSISSFERTRKNSQISKKSGEDFIERDESYFMKEIFLQISKKRNISIILIRIANIITKIQGNSTVELPLVFLLYKQSFIETAALAKYLKKGSYKYLPQISQEIRKKFTKTNYFPMFQKIVLKQFYEIKNTLIILTDSIRKQCVGLLQQDNALSSSRIPKPDNSQFQRQLKEQTLNYNFFKKLSIQYLNFIIKEKQNGNFLHNKQTLIYLNILLKLTNFDSFENFVMEHFYPKKPFASNNNMTIDLSAKKLFEQSKELSAFYSMSLQELEDSLTRKDASTC